MVRHVAEERKRAGEERTTGIGFSHVWRRADQHVKLSRLGAPGWMWHRDFRNQRCRGSFDVFFNSVRRNCQSGSISFPRGPHLRSSAPWTRVYCFQIFRKTRLVFIIEPAHAEILARFAGADELAVAVDVKQESFVRECLQICALRQNGLANALL